ncbi:MAG: hypothetical protein KJN92_13390, partial [Gemmatimonadetes bacterium]|nr:hypothetical protein [Gemmatimonadota bacterium]
MMAKRSEGIRSFLLITVLAVGCTQGASSPPQPPAAPAVQDQPGVPQAEQPTVPERAAAPEQATVPYLDPDLPLDTRVDDLLGRMTLEEKVSQTVFGAPAVERLG